MSRYGALYHFARLEDWVALNDWPILDRWFGMHMVVEPGTEETAPLSDYLCAFGWRLAEHYRPDLAERRATGERTGRPDGAAEDALVEEADHYRQVLLRRLVARWLALD